jgi:hypothetical protein
MARFVEPCLNAFSSAFCPQTNKDIVKVSRADLAQVISGALLNPNACNLVLYMTKSQQRGVSDGDIWQKFARLKTERHVEELPFQ